MRTWRVGTISMGLTLILLGIFLVLSQLFHWKPAYAMLGWWPLILIVLGIEILIYLIRSKEEQPLVKYDIFSIFFVGVIGFLGIGFSIAHATGILEKVYDWTNYEVRTLDLPTYETNLDDSIKRVVVRTGTIPVTFETGTTNQLSVFGTYVTTIVEGNAPFQKFEDYLFVETKEDTLYATLKQMPDLLLPFDPYREWNATMIIPDNVQVEINADYQPIDVHTRTFKNDWTIEQAGHVNVKLGKTVDVKMLAENIDEFDDSDGWKFHKHSKDDDEWEESSSGTKQFGKGTYTMKIANTSSLKVSQQ